MTIRSAIASWRLMLPTMLVMALAMAACGTDDNSPASSSDGADNSRFVIESAEIFTVDNLKSLGWKEQKDLLLEYPGSTDAKWGFYRTKELAILVYPTAAVAQVEGMQAALSQIATGPDGKAIGDIDRISCKQAQGQSAVGLIDQDHAADDPYALHVSFQPEVNAEPADQRVCANKFPTYREFRIIGNIVVLCEGDGKTSNEDSKNCKDLHGQLQGN